MTPTIFDTNSSSLRGDVARQLEGSGFALCGDGVMALGAIGDPGDLFADDALAIARACRLSSQLGVRIEDATLQTMIGHKMRLAIADAGAVAAELDAMLLGAHVHDALMQTVDVLVAVMPEIAACRGFDQHTPYHIYDVWEHTAWVVERSPATSLSRWAALLHDIGKPSACFFEGKRAHFFGHPRLSATMAASILPRLGFDDEFCERVLALVRMHDVQMPATPDAIRTALAHMNGDVELFRALCELKIADALSQSELSRPRLELAYDLLRVLDELEQHGDLG